MINCISNFTFYIDGLILFKCYFQEYIKIIRITNEQLLLTFTISCHSPLYPTSLTILAVRMWSVHSLNPASAGWQTLLRTVIPRGLARVAPEDDTWKVVRRAIPVFWSTNAQRMEESPLLFSCVFCSLWERTNFLS